MSYYTRLSVVCSPELTDLLIAEIAEVGFDSFLENDKGFDAYVEGNQYDADALEAVRVKYAAQGPVSFEFGKEEKRNWNEQWEKSYEPIIVDDQCIIRAEFHQPDRTYPYELIITPKMSFGTGHHQTTYLMIRSQLNIDHACKRVMDAGCGTAILSIMASKLGASHIEAFDIDEWSITNSADNIQLNRCTNITHRQGKLAELHFPGKFDLILANINKNVLLDEIPLYAQYLAPGGQLLLSGFFVTDIPDLLDRAAPLNLTECARDEKENWAALLLQRQ